MPFIEDVSVENDKLAEYIAGLQKIGQKYNIAMSYYGHAGDGELHIRPYLDLGEQGDIEKMTQNRQRGFRPCLVAWRDGQRRTRGRISPCGVSAKTIWRRIL